jgi:hypothetical protein
MRSATGWVAAARACPRARLDRKVALGPDSLSKYRSSPVSVWALSMGIRLTCLIRGRVIMVLHSGVWVMRVGGGSDNLRRACFCTPSYILSIYYMHRANLPQPICDRTIIMQQLALLSLHFPFSGASVIASFNYHHQRSL